MASVYYTRSSSLPPPAVFEVGIKDRIDDYGPLKDATSRVNSKVKAVRETLWTGVYCVMPTDKQYRTGTRVGFREARGAPGLPPTGGLPPNPSIFKTP